MSQLKKGALLSYANIFLTNIIGLILTPFIIRSLGDSEYGLYTLIGAFVGYLSIMDLGLNNTIVRYVSKYRAEKDKKGEENFLGTTMMIYVLISLIIIIAGIVLYYQLDRIFGDSLTFSEMEKAKTMFVILIFNLAITLPGGAFTAICNAYEKFVFPRALNIIKYLIRSLLVYVILTQGADSIGLVILDTVVNLVTIALTFSYSFFKLKARFRFKGFNKVMVGEIFSYSVWIFIFAIISQLQWHGGQLIIGAQLNTVSVAIYAVGIMLGTYYGAFSWAISGLFLPKATQMSVKKATSVELTNMMIKIARFSLFPLIIVFIGFLFVGKEFIHLWINETYEEAYYIAVIIMIGYTLPLIQTFANSLLEARKLFKFKAAVYFISLATGTILSYLFVKKFGVISVIVFIVSFWLIGQLLMNIFYAKVLNLKIKQFFIQVSKGLLLVFVLMLISGFLIDLISIDNAWLELITKIILLVGTYIIFMSFIGMNKEEKKYILTTFKNKI